MSIQVYNNTIIYYLMNESKIKWIKSRNVYAGKNTYMTSEPIDGFYYMTTNDTPNGAWNLYEFTDSNDIECDSFYKTYSEIKHIIKGYKKNESIK